jgi:hypothetical protein
MGFRDAGWPMDSVATIRLEESDEAGGVGRKTGNDSAKSSLTMV